MSGEKWYQLSPFAGMNESSWYGKQPFLPPFGLCIIHLDKDEE